jgi:hypothetical protein
VRVAPWRERDAKAEATDGSFKEYLLRTCRRLDRIADRANEQIRRDTESRDEDRRIVLSLAVICREISSTRLGQFPVTAAKALAPQPACL